MNVWIFDQNHYRWCFQRSVDWSDRILLITFCVSSISAFDGHLKYQIYSPFGHNKIVNEDGLDHDDKIRKLCQALYVRWIFVQPISANRAIKDVSGIKNKTPFMIQFANCFITIHDQILFVNGKKNISGASIFLKRCLIHNFLKELVSYANYTIKNV